MIGERGKPVRMTVILEDGDETLTVVVHRAKNVNLHVNYPPYKIEGIKVGGNQMTVAPAEEISFSFEGKGMFVPELGGYISQSREPKED